ncbi:hypothetical protein BDR03DRAFT_981514 [Suillus americanus]|nr:hypothetical protein BDR03DRAFT_981514 [Suillus americanus]
MYATQPHADLELMHSTVSICLLLYFYCTVPTVWPQPAAYGHLQMLAKLADEWLHVMWWGHKEDRIPYCHAGTSDHPLVLDVKMDCVYAGSSSGSGIPLMGEELYPH